MAKLTKKDVFEVLLDGLRKSGVETITVKENEFPREAVEEVLETEILNLIDRAKYNANRRQAKRVDDDILAEKIAAAMESGKQYRIADVQEIVPETAGKSSQKMTSILNRGVDNGLFVKDYDKRVRVWSLAE